MHEQVNVGEFSPPPSVTDGEAVQPGPSRVVHGARRQGARNLLDTRLAAPTAVHRLRGWAAVLQYAGLCGVEGFEQSAGEHPKWTSAFLATWVQWCYDRGDVALGVVRNGLLAVQDRWWALKGHLGEAWRVLRSWEDGELMGMRRPWPFVLARALLGLSMLWEWWCTGCAIWLQFHALLRPGELLTLTWGQIALPEDIDGEASCWAGVVHISMPKTRRAGGRKQMVLLVDHALTGWLRLLRDVFQPAPCDRIFPQPPAVLCRRLRVLMATVGLRAGDFTAAGLRAGGATHLLRCGASVEWLRHRGRWAALSSMAHYLQEAAAVLAEQHMPLSVRAALRELSRAAPDVLAAKGSELRYRAGQARAGRGVMESPFVGPPRRLRPRRPSLNT